jgi:transketolase
MTQFVEKPYGNALVTIGERFGELVVVDADLQRGTETSLFQAKFPDRYFNVGVAEANMVGVATGLALSGKTAFCGTFACFASQRVCDQAVLAAYCGARVVIVGVEPGLASGSNGATHQTMLDLALMRAIPNMRVLEPGDATETAAMVEYLLEYPAPTYLRAPRGKAPVILEPGSYHFRIGRGVRLMDGGDVTLIACGIMVNRTLTAADELKRLGIKARVVNMSSIKPIDEQEIILAAKETGCIVTAENHNIMGGLGSAVAEVVAGYAPVPIVRVGVHDVFGEVGPLDWLAKKFHIASNDVVEAALRALSMKKGVSMGYETGEVDAP